MKRNLSLILMVCLIISVLFVFAACDKSRSTSGTSYQLETCTSCKGSGVCNVCDGAGQNSYSGHAARTCTICGGNGTCKLCGGSGSVSASTNAQAREDAKQVIGGGGSESGRTGNPCKECRGYGYLNSKCTACNGSGIDSAWEKSKGSAIHSFAEKDCYSCDGTGKKKCFYCSGTGVAN